jgi:hypothetical protein
MQNLGHDPNIEPHAKVGELIESALRTAAEPTAGSARWVAVRARRIGVSRPADPERRLGVDTLGRTPPSPTVSSLGVSTVGDVSEPDSAPGTDVVLRTPPPTEPSGHEASTPTPQRSEKTCDTTVPTGATMLPVGTRGLRLVMTSSNGRRRWAIDVLVRQRSTSTSTR